MENRNSVALDQGTVVR